MDRKRVGSGVKVTYIETSFVTSDAAGFKDLVQRLTGKSPTGAGAAPTAAPQRPRACRPGGARIASAGAGAERCNYYYQQAAGEMHPAVASRAPPCHNDLLLDADFFSDLFCIGAGEQRHHGLNGGYSDIPY